MLKKKDYVFGAIAVYVFLIMLFFILQEKHSIDVPCTVTQPCVRFCCKNVSNCKENYIRDNFNQSLLTDWMTEERKNETKEFLILHGKPKCSLISIPENDPTQAWFLQYVSLQST
jgi:hypothetical protein